MKLAILYICTGKYNYFFKDFYLSVERFLLKDEADKHYFVWTDDEKLVEADNVTLIHKECAGFPADSLFRFDMFLQIEDQLKLFDYIYFFNANAMCLQPIGKEILPDETGLAIGTWPGRHSHEHPMFHPYERNRKSLAYVSPYGKEYTYYMGGLNGGTSGAYLHMIRTLAHNIRDDYKRGIIAKVHDESHINAYLRDHPCKKLGREFCLPEEWMLKSEKPKMIFRNKILVNSDFNKGRRFSRTSRLKKGLNILCNAIRWYIKL